MIYVRRMDTLGLGNRVMIEVRSSGWPEQRGIHGSWLKYKEIGKSCILMIKVSALAGSNELANSS